MPDLTSKRRSWWRLHASSFVVAVVVLVICGAMNVGAQDVDDKPCFGWPFIYFSVDDFLWGDPFEDDPPGVLWIWNCRSEQARTWMLISLCGDGLILLVILASTVGSWEWRRRNRRSLWQFTLLDLMALTALVGVSIFSVQNLYRDNRTIDALAKLREKGEPPQDMVPWSVSFENAERPFFWFFESLHVKHVSQPLKVTRLTFNDSYMTNESFMTVSQLLANFRNLKSLDVKLSHIREINWENCHGFDRMQSLSVDRQVTDVELARLPPWPELKTLRIGVYQATDLGVAQLAKFPQLEVLTFTTVKADTCRGLRTLRKSRSLRNLRIVGSSVRLSSDDLTTIGQLQSLEELTLDGPVNKYGSRPSGTPGISTWVTRPHSPLPLPLSLLGSMPNLRHIKLKSYNIDAEGARVLAKLPALETLEIMECDLKAADLAPLRQCPQLTSLSVECHDLHGESLHVVTDLSQLQNLQLLDAAFTDEDLTKVCLMKILKSLTLEGGNGTRFSNTRGTATMPKGDGEAEITVEFR